MVKVIESINRRNVIHRDMKPENIVTGIYNNHDKLYLIDFGISKIFKNERGKHIS